MIRRGLHRTLPGLWAGYRRQPISLRLAIAAVALMAGAGALAPLISPHDPYHHDVLARFAPPGPDHWLGADRFGRDVLSRILYGTRASLALTGASVAMALAIGGSAGVVAAYMRGWTERIVLRLMDVLFAFPIILLAIGIIAVLGPGQVSTSIAIGIVYVPIFARVLRGPTLTLRESEFVLAARSVGMSGGRILLFHIVPNLSGVLIVQTSLLLSAAILVEASLSFLGLGTQPPEPSLGLMLVESRNYLALSPWPAVFSGLAILFVAFSLNFLGDALRDRLDPRLRD